MGLRRWNSGGRVAPIIRKYLPYVLSLIAIWGFWCTAVSTSWARIAALQTIEPYAFAVHEQLMFNFSTHGEFFQTIHMGYDDNWTWSGHRALSLPVVALLYGLNPSPVWLSIIMITLVTLGAIPSGLIARKRLRSNWAFLFGALLYLISPPTMVMALQDYQDLVLGLPFLMFAFWAFSTGKWWWIAIGAVVGMSAREECIPLTVIGAVLFIPNVWKWKRYLLNLAIVLFITGSYVYLSQKYYPIDTGHDMPLENALRSIKNGQVFLEGWLFLDEFYYLMIAPIGVIAIFSPVLAGGAFALCLLHMTVPDGHGVDRSWSAHCHHMAPALALTLAATVIGGCRIFAVVKKFDRYRISLVVVTLWSAWWWNSWSNYYNLSKNIWPRTPQWEHPGWSLMRQLPADAIPISSKKTSILLSHFTESYTYDESLYSKRPHEGLAAATHAIVDSRRTNAIEWLSMMQGYTVLAEEFPFLLVSWTSNSRDPNARRKIKFSRVQPWTGSYAKAEKIPGVPPHEQTISAQQQGGYPIIDLWDGPRGRK